MSVELNVLCAGELCGNFFAGLWVKDYEVVINWFEVINNISDIDKALRKFII